jgi:hypothetical protein
MISICLGYLESGKSKHVRELDLKHAIQLISQSPGVQLHCGTIEIRPAARVAKFGLVGCTESPAYDR